MALPPVPAVVYAHGCRTAGSKSNMEKALMAAVVTVQKSVASMFGSRDASIHDHVRPKLQAAFMSDIKKWKMSMGGGSRESGPRAHVCYTYGTCDVYMCMCDVCAKHAAYSKS